MAVNVERIVERADAILSRQEVAHVRRLRAISNRTYQRLATEIRRRWPDALDDVAAAGTRTFAEARARALLVQLSALLETLDYGRPESGVPPLVRDMVTVGQETGSAVANELLSAYGASTLAAAQTTTVDVRAVDAAVRNSQARLSRYGREARDRIEQSVVNALVQGQGSQKITRDIREAIRGDAAAPDAGLHARAETIARTELASAKAEASRERYAEAGVEYIQWYATLDERVCPYCGHRHGKVYPRNELVIPAHPRCRCYAAPFRREYTDAGLVDQDTWRQQETEIVALVEKPQTGATPFERANGREYPRAAWTPSQGWIQ